MADDIRALSAAVARDPSSLQYLELAEALRRRGKLDEATQVCLHGLGRHPEHADGYDCLARIHTDRGELAEARAAWERALAIVPEHAGALKGIGFLYFRQGDTKRAADTLEHALAANPSDEALRRALNVLRGDTDLTAATTAAWPTPGAASSAGPGTPAAAPPSRQPRATVPGGPSLADVLAGAAPEATPAPKRRTPSDVPQLRATAAALRAATEGAPRTPPTSAAPAPVAPPPPPPPAPGAEARPAVFAGLEGATADILLLDSHGLVMAGGLRATDGSDVSELAAAALAGVSGEASRTTGYLKLGTWTAIVAEAEEANVVLSPVGEGALLMLRRDKGTAVGLALRIADRARKAATQWLEEQVR